MSEADEKAKAQIEHVMATPTDERERTFCMEYVAKEEALAFLIFSWLDWQDLCRLPQVCRRWRKLLRRPAFGDDLWEAVIFRHCSDKEANTLRARRLVARVERRRHSWKDAWKEKIARDRNIAERRQALALAHSTQQTADKSLVRSSL